MYTTGIGESLTRVESDWTPHSVRSRETPCISANSTLTWRKLHVTALQIALLQLFAGTTTHVWCTVLNSFCVMIFPVCKHCSYSHNPYQTDVINAMGKFNFQAFGFHSTTLHSTHDLYLYQTHFIYAPLKILRFRHVLNLKNQLHLQLRRNSCNYAVSWRNTAISRYFKFQWFVSELLIL